MKRNFEIKFDAKQRMQGRFGDYFIGIFVTYIGGLILNTIVSGFFTFNQYVYTIVNVAIGLLVTYTVVTNTIALIRDTQREHGSNNLFRYNWDNVLMMLLVIGIPLVIYNVISFGANAEIMEWNELLQTAITSNNQTALQDAFSQYPAQAFLILMALGLIGIVFSVVFFPLKYVVAIRGLKGMDAIRTSFDLGSRNFFKIIGMYLSFIGWFILSVFTLFLLLIWLIPYVETSLGLLYLEMDPNVEDGEIEIIEPGSEPVVEANQEQDPFAKYDE